MLALHTENRGIGWGVVGLRPGVTIAKDRANDLAAGPRSAVIARVSETRRPPVTLTLRRVQETMAEGGLAAVGTSASAQSR